jgi:hypothetical protein
MENGYSVSIPFSIFRFHFRGERFSKKIVARQKIKSYLDASQRMASLLPALHRERRANPVTGTG